MVNVCDMFLNEKRSLQSIIDDVTNVLKYVIKDTYRKKIKETHHNFNMSK